MRWLSSSFLRPFAFPHCQCELITGWSSHAREFSFCASPEIVVARSLGAELTIKQGVIVYLIRPSPFLQITLLTALPNVASTRKSR